MNNEVSTIVSNHRPGAIGPVVDPVGAISRELVACVVVACNERACGELARSELVEAVEAVESVVGV
jgi:hypothetical protein